MNDADKKVVVYNYFNGLAFTTLTNYRALISNARKVYEIPWCNTFEEAKQYLVDKIGVPEGDIINKTMED